MSKYYFIGDKIQEVTSDEIAGMFQYSLSLAEKEKTKVTIVVNKLSNSDQFVKACCDEKYIARLKRGQSIYNGDIEVQLRSRDGIKQFGEYGVIFGIHLSVASLEVIKQRAEAVAVVAIENSIEEVVNWLALNGYQSLEKNA
ncbi:hypothetical protein [Saccharophagus degradans]|uniref:Uncharacterized protein n=1 Tax=Saccharophagus degradans TaxID=86304 RepID=A0AAW7X617_9GAMM|nr:hypothetical protein [Saccharophagus degradans]MDO6422302.1 hypothetical protein [Saccharophagus degradans]MDO6609815.1 hypothetical protein [Saccharophagus degradans]